MDKDTAETRKDVSVLSNTVQIKNDKEGAADSHPTGTKESTSTTNEDVNKSNQLSNTSKVDNQKPNLKEPVSEGSIQLSAVKEPVISKNDNVTVADSHPIGTKETAPVTMEKVNKIKQGELSAVDGQTSYLKEPVSEENTNLSAVKESEITEPSDLIQIRARNGRGSNGQENKVTTATINGNTNTSDVNITQEKAGTMDAKTTLNSNFATLSNGSNTQSQKDVAIGGKVGPASTTSTTTPSENMAKVGVSTSHNDIKSIETIQPDSVETINTGKEDDPLNPTSHILSGQVIFDNLPALPKKIVRIFISSTFTDTKEERNALMQNVYPKLSDYCREKFGLDFQVVDMRWGVPEAASDNHSTSQLCIQEIKKCKEVSAGPNFVALVGDKYGYRPIPSSIEEAVFEKLQSTAKSCNILQWEVVEQWYLKDENAIPAVYILQPISTKINNYNSDKQELKRQAQNDWNTVNQLLMTSLRLAAEKACQAGSISDSVKRSFFMSVTESEITEGVLRGDQSPLETCFCIIRKIKDLSDHLTETQFPRFADTTPTKQIDTEAQELLNQLRDAKLEGYLPQTNLMKLDIEWTVSGASMSLEQLKPADSNSKPTALGNDSKQQEYLSKLCSDFMSAVTHLIDQGGTKEENLYDELTLEVLQHWHLARTRCDVFEGREDVLTSIEEFVKDETFKGPLIVHGCSGSGKTSVMSKVVECVSNGSWNNGKNKKYLLLPRFLGTTTSTSNVHQLLVNLCTQLAHILGEEWKEPEKFKDLADSFHLLLSKTSMKYVVIVLLDSVDQLMPAYNAFKLKWLPEVVPGNVKILVSTIDEGYTIYNAFVDRYRKFGFKDVQIKALGEKLGLQVVSKWLKKDNRKITEEQSKLINQAFTKCSLPLFARIIYDQVIQWKSYEITVYDQLETTVRGAIDQLFLKLEEKFGGVMVKHSIAYLTAARNGLSETELEHVLSLDDTLLNDVFKFWNPPIRRIPPLLWTRIRSEIHNYLVERSADDTLVLAWYHRQFIEAAKVKYLSEQTFRKYIHGQMVEFFTGKWGGGKQKPFQYTEAQVARFRLQSASSEQDRHVPMNPYWTEYRSGTHVNVRYNKRKLSELPFHLVKSKNYHELKALVFFSYEWLFAKIKSSSVQQTLEEFEIFMQADPIVKKCSEMKLLYSNIQLMKPYILQFPESLAYEITGRLSRYTGQAKYVTHLIKDCDEKGTKQCPIVPLTTCFKTAEVGFTQNIQFRKNDPWVPGGAMTCTDDFKTLYILDHADDSSPVLLTYDIATGERISQTPLIKPKDGTIDMYSELYLTNNSKILLACYRQKSEGITEKKFRDKYGLVDVIEIENGNVSRTFEGFLNNEEYLNPVQYLRDNFVCVDFVDKIPVINFISNEQIELNKSTFLSADENLFIVCGRNKTNLKQYESKEVIGTFDVTEPQLSVGGADDFSLIILVESKTHILRFYDLKGKTQSNKGQIQQLKCKKNLNVNDNKMKIAIETIFETREYDKRIFPRHRATVIVAPEKNYFMVVYRGWDWIAYVYSINVSTWHVKYIGALTEPQPCTVKYPRFNHNGSCIILVTGNKVSILSSSTLDVLQEHEMTESINDFCISKSTDTFLVLLQKSVVMLTISEDHKIGDVKKARKDNKVHILFQREVTNNQTFPEVVMSQVNEKVVLEEVKDLASYVDTDRVSTATSKRKYALSKTKTPNGKRTIHYHAKAQVIDTKADKIEYRLKKDDILVRVKTLDNGTTVNENIPISDIDCSGSRSLNYELRKGDKIITENNKVKFRINTCEDEQYKILRVPSVLTTYSVEDLKLKRLQSVTVYKETVLTISNNFIVTSKSTAMGHFVNIYSQNKASLHASHSIPQPCQYVRFTSNESQLFIADSSLTVYGYTTPGFNALEMKMESLNGNNLDIKYQVRGIFCFEKNSDCILVCYTPEGQHVSAERHYVYSCFTTKHRSKIMVIKPSFEDVSMDGHYAVDGNLNLYELYTGNLMYQIKGHGNVGNPTESHYLAKICPDNKKLVYVNKQDDSLHLIRISTSNSAHIFSCYCHSPDIVLKGGISWLNDGHNLMINSKSGLRCFALKMNSDNRNANLSHANELSRAVSIMNTWCGVRSVNNEQSVFYQRRTLEQEEQSQVQKENMPEEKNFNRDNPEKPQVMVVCEPVLSTLFRPEQLSSYLITEMLQVNSADTAAVKIAALTKKYDAIVLQLITEDVKGMNDVETCVTKVNNAVEQSKQKCRHVFVSLSPAHGDEQINSKIRLVNEALLEKYKSGADSVYICVNDNLSDSSSKRPISKYYQGGVVLSEVGVKQLMVNIKDVMLPVIAKTAPDIQTSGNKQLYMFWSKFM